MVKELLSLKAAGTYDTNRHWNCSFKWQEHLCHQVNEQVNVVTYQKWCSSQRNISNECPFLKWFSVPAKAPQLGQVPTREALCVMSVLQWITDLPYTYDLPQFNHVIGLKYWKCFCIVWTDLCWKGKNSSWKQHLSMDGKLQLCLLLIHVTTVRRGKNILFVIEKVRKISGTWAFYLQLQLDGWFLYWNEIANCVFHYLESKYQYLQSFHSLTLARLPMASSSSRGASDFLNYLPKLDSYILVGKSFFFFKNCFPEQSCLVSNK